jgi:hypothetical protein
MDEEENLFKTTLILKIEVGDFPADRNQPIDFEEYLAQSDHTIQECEIIGVEQEKK